MAVPHDQIANNTLRGYQPASTVSASSVKFVPRRSAYSASGMSRIGDQRARPHTFGKPFLNNINTQPRSLNEFEHLLCQLEQRVLAAVERQVKERIEALETKTTSLVLTVERQVNEWNERIAAVETENISFGQTLETAFEEHRAFRAAFEEKLNPIDASLANMHNTLLSLGVGSDNDPAKSAETPSNIFDEFLNGTELQDMTFAL